MTKQEHFEKLLAWLGERRRDHDAFVVPVGPGSAALVKAVGQRLGDDWPQLLVDRDIVDIRVELQHPLAIKVYVANESHHNGDEYNKKAAVMEMFEQFLDFAIALLRNRAHNIILAEIDADEIRAKELRVQSRMKELGL